jgi:hypothetical protein
MQPASRPTRRTQTLTEQGIDTRPFPPAKRNESVTGEKDGCHWVWGSDGNLCTTYHGTFFSYEG